MDQGGGPVAGWYADPFGAAPERWWNGAQWCAETRAPVVAAVQTAVPVAVPAPAYAEPVGFGYGPAATATTAVDPAPLAWTAGPRGPQFAAAQASTTVWRGSPDTVGGWLLAALPTMAIVVEVAVQVVWTLLVPSEPLNPLLVYVPLLVAAWIFAGFDAGALSRRGYAKPSILWMLLLPPLVYFIARGRSVRRAGGRAWVIEVVFFGQVALSWIAGAAITAFALSLVRGY